MTFEQNRTDDFFENYPRWIGGVIAFLDDERHPNLNGVPASRRRPGSPFAVVEAENIEDYDELAADILSNINAGHLRTGRPGNAGFDAHDAWELHAQYRAWLGESVENVIGGMRRAAVMLFASKIGVTGDRLRELENPATDVTLKEYARARKAIATKFVAATDLDRWVANMRGRTIGETWRGELITGAALSRVDGWWHLRNMPLTALGVYAYQL